MLPYIRISACLWKGVIAITEDEVRERLRAAVRAAGTQSAYAEQIGASEQYVSDVLRGARRPGQRILRALRLRKRTVYGAEDDYSEA